MKKTYLLVAALLGSFALGYALRSINAPEAQPRKAVGIGGIFFKCKDPKATRAWYAKHLGLNTNQYGAVFEYYQGADNTKKGFLQWSPFSEKTKYFAPSSKEFMINYRVLDLNSLMVEFKRDSVTVCDTVENTEYGKFVHILDPEGNKIELWEPNDVVYEKMGAEMGAMTTK